MPSAPTIHVLPDAVINQIAAGEVVERPASVVKELVENALDSGATQITVTLEGGGRDRISVLDNGCGMGPTDAALAVQRHATSKLSDAQGLTRIRTLGFRGEALAAISAVSRFELVSCAQESSGGTRLEMAGGELRSQGRIGFPQGTRITVEELFYNTPARRKFLRTPATEFQHAQGVFVQLALAHRHVHLRLIHHHRTLYDLPACTALGERVHQLFGRELSAGLVAVEGREATFRFEGLVSDPGSSRSSRRWQWLFVNGRHVRNPSINHGVYQAYRTLLMKDRHPAYVLMLTVDPEEVDVNVHPAKSEVRMRNQQLVHAALSTQLHLRLMQDAKQRAFAPETELGTGLADGLVQSEGQATLPGLEPGTRGGAGAAMGVARPQRPSVQPVQAGQSRPAGQPVRAGFPQAHVGAVHEALPQAALAQGAAWAGHAGAGGSPFGAEQSGAADGGGGLRVNPFGDEDFHFQPLLAPTPGGQETLVSAGMSVLGQFHSTYILAQRDDTLVLVDQHAAHERVLFEQYRSQFYQERLTTERYLIPINLELSPQNGLLLEQYLPQWRRMGFDIEPFGRDNYLVRQVPGLIAGRDIAALIRDVLDELALFGKSGRLEEVINEILERVACHSAIRAGMILPREEMEALLSQLQSLDINLYCPHGRPVWVEFPLHDLEKRFKRIV